MRRERNEHSVESEMEGIRKGYIYISALLFQNYKNMKKKEKRKKKIWDSGTGTTLTSTGTTCAKSGSGHSVPVPHLLVSVPSGVFWETRVFKPLFPFIFIPLLPHHHIRQTLALLSTHTNKSEIARFCQCFHLLDSESSQFIVQTW